MLTPFQSELKPAEREAITITALVMRSYSDSSLPFLKSNTTVLGKVRISMQPLLFGAEGKRAYVYLSV